MHELQNRPQSDIDDDLIKNPTKYGFCSFAEFRKNADKWRPHKDQLLRSVDSGAKGARLKDRIKEHAYFVEGYYAESLERVESLAGEMGIDSKNLKIGAIVRDQLGGGKERLNVHFMSTDTIEKRKTW